MKRYGFDVFPKNKDLIFNIFQIYLKFPTLCTKKSTVAHNKIINASLK